MNMSEFIDLIKSNEFNILVLILNKPLSIALFTIKNNTP